MCAVVFWRVGLFCIIARGAKKLGPMAGQTAPKRRGKIFSRGGRFSQGTSGGIIPGYHTEAAPVLSQFCSPASNLRGWGALRSRAGTSLRAAAATDTGRGVLCAAGPPGDHAGSMGAGFPAGYPGGRKGRQSVSLFVTRVGEKGDTMSDKRETWCLPNYPVRTNQSSTAPAREDKKTRSRRSCRAGPPGRIR